MYALCGERVVDISTQTLITANIVDSIQED